MSRSPQLGPAPGAWAPVLSRLDGPDDRLPLDRIRLLDLSVTLGPNPSEVVPIELQPISHDEGGAHLAELVGVPQPTLEGGFGWASERLSAVTHAGTHMDAPWHYGPLTGGAPSRTIDEIPLDWCLAPAVCWSLAPSTREEPVGLDVLLDFERRHGALAEGTIVLFHTGAQEAYGRPDYARSGRPLRAQLVEGLLERGVRIIGTDAWSIDPSIEEMRRQAEIAGGESVWRAHRVGRRQEFCILEKLCRLDQLPQAGFWVACFPVKLSRGSAAWVRPVAFLPVAEKRR